MSNLFIISNNTRILVDRLNLLIKKEIHKKFFRKDTEEKKVKFSNIENIFILNEKNLEEDLKSLLLKKKINIFCINSFGNIENIYVFTKGLKRFNFKNPLNISRYIIKREIYSIGSLMKQNLNLGKYYSSIHKENILNKSFDNADFMKLKIYHSRNLLELDTTINAMFPGFKRKIISKDPKNITVNFLYSFGFCFLISFFLKKKINPFNSEKFWFKTENKNYSEFIKAIFTQFRISSTLTALRTHESMLTFKDFRIDKSLNDNGKLLISKVFTEKFVHNPKLFERLYLFWEELQSIDNKKIN